MRNEIEQYFADHEPNNVHSLFTVAGGGGGGGAVGQNTGQGFINLMHWDERRGKENSADAIVQRATARSATCATPRCLPWCPDRSAASANRRLHHGASKSQRHEPRGSSLRRGTGCWPRPTTIRGSTSVRLSDLPDVATLKVDLDTSEAHRARARQADVNTTLSTAWGGRYVNDFIDRGRVKRVYVQGDAPYRAEPEDLSQWYVRSANGEMAPFSAFARIGWATGPSTCRVPGRARVRIPGPGGAGRQLGRGDEPRSSARLRDSRHQRRWAGQSFQERLSSGQAPLLYALSLLVVFLCLAALYESWSIPVAVLLVVPLGLVGAIFAVTLRGLENDVFLQIGLLTTMGLAAKNAILMIEFAERQEKSGSA